MILVQVFTLLLTGVHLPQILLLNSLLSLVFSVRKESKLCYKTWFVLFVSLALATHLNICHRCLLKNLHKNDNITFN